MLTVKTLLNQVLKLKWFVIENVSFDLWYGDQALMGKVGTIGIDEIQIGSGHSYMTVVYQIDQGCRLPAGGNSGTYNRIAEPMLR